MKIKLIPQNLEKIQAALDEINGKATKHVYTAQDVLKEAEEAEHKLRGLPKVLQVGAKAYAESGESLPNAYKHSRVVNYVRIERFASGWFLTDLGTKQAWRDTVSLSVSISPEQGEELTWRILENRRVFIKA